MPEPIFALPLYPVFFDLAGRPLDAGYIYIGDQGQNPEAIPAQVYWDAAMTQPAAQPIRTIAGYPSRNGSQAAIYTAGDYSITVRDKGRVLVYTALTGVNIVAAATAEAQEAADFCRSLAFQQAFSFDTVAGQQFYPLAFNPGQQLLLLDKNGAMQIPGTHYTIATVSGVVGVQFVGDVLYSGDLITYRLSRAIAYDPNVNRIEGFHSRADLVAHIAAEGEIDGQTYTAEGLFYLGTTGATAISDLPGLLPAGEWTLRHFGAAGDGVTDDSAAIIAAFANPVHLVDPEGKTFLIDGTTIPVTHPSSFEGVGGKETRFVFTNMGGFVGLDGFDVTVPLDAPYKSETRFEKCSVVVRGSNGKAGIRTPSNPDGNGSTIFNTISPRFVFRDLVLGGDELRSPGANLISSYGWMDCIASGESDNSEFCGLTIMQPFYAPADPVTWGDTINTSGVRLSGRIGADGSGPVRNPLFDHIMAHGCGAPIRFNGFISTPRMCNMDTFANYYGGFVHTGAISVGGGPALLSEASVTNVQFNGIAGGCKIDAADYLTMFDPDITDTSFGAGVDVDYTDDWIGIEIVQEIRQLSLFSPRFYAARPTATNDHRAVKGTISAASGTPSFVNIYDPDIRNATTASPSEDQFSIAFELNDANFLSVTNPTMYGNIGDLIGLTGTIFTSPRINLIAQKSGAVQGELVVLGAGLSWVNVRNIAAPVSGVVRATTNEIVQSVFENGGTTPSDRTLKNEAGWMKQNIIISGVAGPTTATGSGFSSAEVTLNYLEAFAEVPLVKASVRSAAAVWANVRPISATQYGLRLHSWTSVAGPFFVEIEAEGLFR